MTTKAITRKQDDAAELLYRQVSVGICGGMSYGQMAEALEVPLHKISRIVNELFNRTGMSDRLEFALRQNAAVRELAFPEAA